MYLNLVNSREHDTFVKISPEIDNGATFRNEVEILWHKLFQQKYE